MKTKICIKPQCRKKYDDSHPNFHDGFCDCGARLENSDENPSDASLQKELGPPLFDDEGNVILPGDVAHDSSLADNIEPDLIEEESSERGQPDLIQEEPELLRKPEGTHIVIYFGGEPVKVEKLDRYDEYILGRASGTSRVAIDLSDFSPNKEISRQHLMIHRLDYKYYARNISMKSSVHINDDPLFFNADQELSDGDKIVLSGLIGIEFCSGKDADLMKVEDIEELQRQPFSQNPEIYYRARKLIQAFASFPNMASLKSYINRNGKFSQEDENFILNMKRMRNHLAHERDIPNNLPSLDDIDKLKILLNVR